MYSALRYELELLESIISDNLPQSGERSVNHPDSNYEVIGNALSEEVERIKKKFVHEVFAFGDERHLERYIQFHQQELIRITDELSTRKAEFIGPESTVTSDSFKLVHQAYQSVEELLVFIERHFTKYFDQDTKAPESYIVLTGSDVVRNFGSFQDQLGRLDGDANLIELALAPLKNFIENVPGNQITYRWIIYIKEVQKELRTVISSGKTGEDLNEDLRLVLMYLNYNSVKYFRYYTNHISGLLTDIDSSPGRIERLSYVLKMINQSQVKPGVGYNRTMRTLKEQISDWVNEEIIYLERIHRLNTKHSKADSTMDEGFKVRTEMPVAQLAYLLRIFVEMKIIQNQNVSELIRFFSRFFLSKRMESISYESFRVRYYNTEDSTKRNIRNMLLSMVDYINKA